MQVHKPRSPAHTHTHTHTHIHTHTPQLDLLGVSDRFLASLQGAPTASGMRGDDCEAVPLPQRTMSAAEREAEEKADKELAKKAKEEAKAAAEQEGATKMMAVLWKMTVIDVEKTLKVRIFH